MGCFGISNWFSLNSWVTQIRRITVCCNKELCDISKISNSKCTIENYMCLYHAEFYPYQISFIPNVSSLDGHPSWITACVWAVDGQNHDLLDGNIVVADLNLLVSTLQRLRKLVKIVVKLISYDPEIWNSDSKCILNWKH